MGSARVRQRFNGQIAGVGSTSGIRVVVGHWPRSPFGPFADAMVERPDGRRFLLAPTEQVAEFVSHTYEFDEVRIEPFAVQVTGEGAGAVWEIASASLRARLQAGPRMPLGHLLRLVPRPLATSPTWAGLIDPIARVLMSGVRTRGTALAGRRESYGATDIRRVVVLEGEFDGIPLGSLAPVDPPCRFGFSSTPRTPSITTVATTVETLGT